MTRRGFTLLELLIALVLAGVVALLVYGAVHAGADTEARIAAARRRWQSQQAMRTLIEDALRNARPALRAGDAAFALQTRTAADGVPQDRLTFVTRGGFPPLTGDADWRVTIEATPAGVSAVAIPLGTRAPARVAGTLAGMTGIEIRVQPPGGGPWSRQWTLPAAFPRAVALTFWSDSGPSGAPLRVTLPLGGGL
jgi:prepilin-type N-terminal cleavage/methylation domain-containing protein